MANPVVDLDPGEVVVCNVLAALRAAANRFSGVKDAKIGPQNGLAGDVDGLMGEIAYARHLNVMPDLSIRPRSGSPDLIYQGKGIDVKATRHASGKLVSTLKVNEDVERYVLAIILEGHRVELAGWCVKGELIQPQNVTNLGHGPTYALEQKFLRKWAA